MDRVGEVEGFFAHRYCMKENINMASTYYKPCAWLDLCRELIEQYFERGDYKTCFDGYYEIAKCGYPLAECQVGYFYMEGLGVEKDEKEAFYWTEKAAIHGDRDAQFNLAVFYENGTGVGKNMDKECFRRIESFWCHKLRTDYLF